MYPKIYLSIDNCFASKRWTKPAEWAQVISGLGVQCVEASADTELDPLFMGKEYLRDWQEHAKQAKLDHNIKVTSLYSGHGTYSTLGLAHTDSRVRRRMVEDWFKPMISMAAALKAGMGFFAHAFPEAVLRNPTLYAQYRTELMDTLSELSAFAGEVGCRFLAVEEMYSPHQIPWTISQTIQLLKTVFAQSGKPFYFTEDVGHHQRKFIRPSEEQIRAAVEQANRSIWLGSDAAYTILEDAIQAGRLTQSNLDAILEAMDEMPHLFASEEDSDCYQWLRTLGCYSPIIHLQQTNGVSSKHEPFTPENNRHGIIHGDRILKALKEAYDAEAIPGMPPKCEEIYLTLELFSGTASTAREILGNYAQTVQYWRQFIPMDGCRLDTLV